MKKPESFLASRLSNYMLDKHNKIPFQFSIGADVKLPIHVAKNLHQIHGKWSRGFVDMNILSGRGGYGGLLLELKATEELLDNEHTRRQAQFHAVLRHNGYKCMFCLGYKECKKIIKKYLKMKLNCVK